MLVYMCVYVSVRVVWYALLYTCMCVKTPNYVYRESRVEIFWYLFLLLSSTVLTFLSFFFFLFIYLMCMCVFSECISAHHIHTKFAEARRGQKMFCDRSYQLL